MGGETGHLSDQALPPDAADAVRHFRADLRDAAAGARQHRRHPVRRRRHDRPGREGQARARARPRPADRRAVRRTGSAAWRTAISAIPTSRRSRRSQEILPRIPITAKLAGLALSFAVLFGVPLGVISAVRQNTRARLCAARRQPERAVDAVVLARPADPDGVRRTGSARSRSTPTRRRRFWNALALLQHSGGGGRLPHLGADDAADALLDAGGAAPGLHPHRARQGRLRARPSIIITRCATRCCRSSP